MVEPEVIWLVYSERSLMSSDAALLVRSFEVFGACVALESILIVV